MTGTVLIVMPSQSGMSGIMAVEKDGSFIGLLAVIGETSAFKFTSIMEVGRSKTVAATSMNGKRR